MYIIKLDKKTPTAIRHNLVGRCFNDRKEATDRVNKVPSGIRAFMKVERVKEGSQK